MAVCHLLWIQAIATVALAIYWLTTKPSGPTSKACVAVAGLACGVLSGWYASVGRHITVASGRYFVDCKTDRLLCLHFQLQTVGLVTLAIFWCAVAPEDPQTLVWCTFAGVTVGCSLGWDLLLAILRWEAA